MFWATISPIFRSTRLCDTTCGIMHPWCCQPVPWKPPLPGYRPATSWVHYTTSCNTQSSVPEDVQNNRPKHVERIGIINKPLMLHIVGCLYLFRYNSIQILGFGLDDSWFVSRQKKSLSSQNRPKRLWGPSSFLLKCYCGSFPGLWRASGSGREADHSSTSSAEVKNE